MRTSSKIILSIIIFLILILFISYTSRKNLIDPDKQCCIDEDLCKKIDAFLKKSHLDSTVRDNNIIGAAKWNYILPNELYELMKSNKFSGNNVPLLLDVRRPEDYKKEHIPGSINIFWLNLMENKNICKLVKLTDNKKRPIILICYVGHTSSQTLVLLSLLGFKVISLKYGMAISPVKEVPLKGWTDYDYPVESS